MSEHSRRWGGVWAVWLAVCLLAARPDAAGGANAVLASVHGPVVFRFTEADRPLVGALERLADRPWDRLVPRP